MKKKVLVAAILFGISFGLLPCTGVMNAVASDYIGQHCWNFTNTNSPGKGVIKLGISHLGDAHYVCSGIIRVTSPAEFQMPAYGNVEIIGNNIIITLTVAGRRNGALGNIISVITLNSKTLNGSSESIGFYSDSVEDIKGTVTYTKCPTP